MTETPSRYKKKPSYCPEDKGVTWDAHPLTYLKFLNGEAFCPYCSKRYQITNSRHNINK